MATQYWICTKSHRLEVGSTVVKDPKKKGPPCKKDVGGKPCGCPTTAKWLGRYQDTIKRFPTKKEADDWEGEQRNGGGEIALAKPGEERPVYWPEAKELFEHYMDIYLLADTPKQKAELKERQSRPPLSPILKDVLTAKTRIAKEDKELSPNTRRKYLIDFNMLSTVFSNYALQDLGVAVVEDWMKDYRENGYSPGNLNGVLVTLQNIMKRICLMTDVRRYPLLHAVKDQVCSVKQIKYKSGKNYFLEGDEWQLLLKHASTPQLKHFILGIVSTGLRHTDMLKLKVSEINFRTGFITTTVKGRKEVTIKLSPEYRDYLLTNWLPKKQNVISINGYLIPTVKNPAKCYNTSSDMGFRRAREKAAKEAEEMGNHELAAKLRKTTPHTLRHTFATNWIYSNLHSYTVDGLILVLSQILGHSRTTITDTYMHYINHYQQQPMENYSARMFAGLDVSKL